MRERADWKTAIDREKIINEYGRFIERHPPLPTRIEDVSVLPYPKETILAALLLEITRGDVLKTGTVRICARDLAQFQPGVGREPLEMLGVDLAKLPSPPRNNMEGRRSYLKFVTEAEGNTRSRFDEFSKLVEEDLGRINAEIEAAVALSQAMPKEQKKRVLD